jgi:hypothetical protein
VDAAPPNPNERCTSEIGRCTSGPERTLHFERTLTSEPERTLHFWNRTNAVLLDLNERCTSGPGIERTLHFSELNERCTSGT